MSPTRALLVLAALLLAAGCVWSPPLTDAVTDAGIGSTLEEDGGAPDAGVTCREALPPYLASTLTGR